VGQLIALAVLVLAGQIAARLAVPGGEVAYEVVGRGPAVVLLHGGFMDRRSWDRVVPELSKSYRVVRYDIRPFGESTAPKEPYFVPDDLLRLLNHLKIDRAHLVGHSFGGGVALDFALAHPTRVATLTLVAAPPGGFAAPAEEARAVGAIFAAAKQGDEAVLRAWLGHPMWSVSRTRPEVLNAIEASTRRSLHAFALTSAPYVPMKPAAIDRLAEVKAPALIVVGDHDMQSIRVGAGAHRGAHRLSAGPQLSRRPTPPGSRDQELCALAVAPCTARMARS
jgi:pimeloyl-ACP methyl ester carboxylesterase